MNHKKVQNCLEPPSAEQNHQESTKCTSPCHTQLEVVWFQFFTILNKIDRLTFTRRKAQFFLKEITPPIITCSTTDTVEHGVFTVDFNYISRHVLVFPLFTLNR